MVNTRVKPVSRQPRRRLHPLLLIFTLGVSPLMLPHVLISQAWSQTITTDQAIAQALRKVRGKVVSVSKEQQGSTFVYRVRILGTDGVVRTVLIAATP